MKLLVFLIVAGVAAYFAPAPVSHEQASIEIETSRARVWELVTDLELARRWDPAVREAQAVSSVREGRGAERRTEGTFLKSMERVTEWEEQSRISYDVRHEPNLTRMEKSTIEIMTKGSFTQVVGTLDYQMNGGYLGVVLDRTLLGGAIRGRLEPALGNLKRLAETGEVSPGL